MKRKEKRHDEIMEKAGVVFEGAGEQAPRVDGGRDIGAGRIGMPKKRETQIQILETERGERGMSVAEFAEALGVSRQWYYDRLNRGMDLFHLKALSVLAVDQVGTWRGELAVKCIRIVSDLFVPCVCETELWDKGPCPRHPRQASSVKDLVSGVGVEAEAV